MASGSSAELYEFLKRTSPIECDIVGDSVVLDISVGMGAADFIEVGEGERLDFKTVIEVLAAMAAFFTALVQLRNEWRTGKANGPQAEAELQRRLRELENKFDQLTPEQKHLAVKDIFPDEP